MPQHQWPPPKSDGHFGVSWTEEDRGFVPDDAIESQLGLGDVLYDLRHPSSGCKHSDAPMPPFFKTCPECGKPLRDEQFQGTWLPPFGWSPFCGLGKNKVYHPRSLRSPFTWVEPDGDGPLRLWLCPQGVGLSSAWYAYRPKLGALYSFDPLRSGSFERVKIEGDGDAQQALRGSPVGSARSWAPAWLAGRMIFATDSGLLALIFMEPGRVQVEKVLEGACVASPAVNAGESLLMVPVVRSGKIQIAVVKEVDEALHPQQTLEWTDGVSPEFGLSKSASAATGVIDGDAHWIFGNGVAVTEGSGAARWYAVGDEIVLEPRVSPDFRGGEPEVYGWYEDPIKPRSLKRYKLSQLIEKTGKDVGDASKFLVFPSGGADRKFWYCNGDIADYDRTHLFTGDPDHLRNWPLGVLRLFSTLRNDGIPALLFGKFDKLSLSEMMPAGDGKTVSVLTCELRFGGEGVPRTHRLGGMPELRMPLDTLMIPISAEMIVLYGGDSSPKTVTLDFSNCEPIDLQKNGRER